MGGAGKLPGLVWLLREHGEAVEADFQRYYGIDLAGLWRGEITPRRVMVLAKNLPYGAQTWIAAGTDNAWTPETHLLSHVAFLLEGANWQRGGGKGKSPKPMETPGEAKRTQEKRERALKKAARFKQIHGVPKAAPPPSVTTTTDRPRDSRGRFVSRRG